MKIENYSTTWLYVTDRAAAANCVINNKVTAVYHFPTPTS